MMPSEYQAPAKAGKSAEGHSKGGPEQGSGQAGGINRCDSPWMQDDTGAQV